MAVRLHVIAAVLFSLAGCGGDREPRREVRVLAPAGVVAEVTRFERASGCRVDLRIYDEEEDVEAIARRREADVVADAAPPGTRPHVSNELVRITLAQGLEITIPKRLASAFKGETRSAGRRDIVWRLRPEGENDACARRWLAGATSRSARS
jgi:hypothetical protein